MKHCVLKQSVNRLINELPREITIVAVAKTRSVEELDAVKESGIEILGFNYVQEAEKMCLQFGSSANWHMIGHLQSNKVKRAVRLFDMIETVDSMKLAYLISRQCECFEKVMPVLIEINSGKEFCKTGVLPEDAEELAKYISKLPNLKLQGLMTMGPRFGNPEDARQYFRNTKEIFNKLNRLLIPNCEMKYLSMGMSNNYHVAIEEGANLIRLGRTLFEQKEAVLS